MRFCDANWVSSFYVGVIQLARDITYRWTFKNKIKNGSTAGILEMKTSQKLAIAPYQSSRVTDAASGSR